MTPPYDTHPYETWAGPYVLGALSPAERYEFAQHLTGCEDCRAAVEQLAGLPGLLSKVPESVVVELSGGPAAEDPIPPLPDTLLPNLLRAARRGRRRLVGIAVAGVAAAAVAVLFGIGIVGGPQGSTPPRQSAATSMVPEPGVPVSASVALTPVGWGTRLDLTCEYEGYQRGPVDYSLVVLDRTGEEQQVGTWRAEPGKTVRMTSGTAFPRADIGSVQIRTMSGRTVLRLDVAGAATAAGATGATTGLLHG